MKFLLMILAAFPGIALAADKSITAGGVLALVFVLAVFALLMAVFSAFIKSGEERFHSD